MYQELLKKVEAEQNSFGEKLQPACSEESLYKFLKEVMMEFNLNLPQDYAEFLRKNNGFDWNGVVIYACDTTPIAEHENRTISGFVEMNQIYREDERFNDLLVFGSDGMDIYVQRISTGEFQIIDEVAYELIETLPSFDALLSKALERSLQ